MKWILLLFLLLFAYGIAVILIRRLNATTQQIADLRQQMARNDEKLSAQVESLSKENETP